MATPGIRRLTYEDYVKIPADGDRHEILGGEEFVTPAPDVGHQRVSRRLLVLLDRHVEATGEGEVLSAPIDAVLTDTDIVQPDLVWVSSGHGRIIGERNIQGAPDLVVEILSPSTAAVDRGRKLGLYERCGVREYWIVDRAARLVEVHVFGTTPLHRVLDDRGVLESALLPGLKIRVAEIFGAAT